MSHPLNILGCMEPVLDVRSDDEVEASIVAAHEALCALHRRLLADVAEHDRREAFGRAAAKDEEAFLVNLLGLGRRTAHNWVNAAHVLEHHPDIAARYVAGEMSTDQLVSVVDMVRLRLPGADKPAGPFGADPHPGGETGEGDGDRGSGGSSDADGSGAGEPGPVGSSGAVGGPGGGPSDNDELGDGGDPGVGDGSARGSGAGDGGARGSGAGDGGAGGSGGAEGDGGTASAVDEVLDLASRLSPGQLAAAVHRLRRRSREQAAAGRRRRHVRAFFDEANSRLRLDDGELFDDQALLVWSAMVEYAKRCGKDPATGKFDPLPVRFADALAEMASAYLAGRHQLAGRPAVFAICDADVLAGKDGWAESLYGSLAADAVRRMACDCDLTLLAEGSGNRLFMGRTKRSATWQQAVMVIRRDGGCRVPGCGQKLFLHIHHMQEWAKDLGPTNWDLMFPVCSYHHHMVHEGGWTVTGNPMGELVFTDPTGKISLSSWPNPAVDDHLTDDGGDRAGSSEEAGRGDRDTAAGRRPPPCRGPSGRDSLETTVAVTRQGCVTDDRGAGGYDLIPTVLTFDDLLESV